MTVYLRAVKSIWTEALNPRMAVHGSELQKSILTSAGGTPSEQLKKGVDVTLSAVNVVIKIKP